MAKQYQSIDPTLVAINAAKKVTPQAKKTPVPSLTTQAPIQPSLNLQTQQPQAISTNITPPPANIGGISSSFGAPNINSAPMLGGATPNQIQERATQLQSLPKQIPASGAAKKIDVNVIGSLGANVMAGEDIPTIRSKYPEFSNIDDEVLGSVLATMYDGVGPEEILQKFPELQGGGQESNKVMDFLSQVAQPFKTVGEGLAGLTTKAGEYLDPDTYNPAIQAANAATMGAGLVDGSIQPRSEAENRYMNKSLSQNILDTAEGTAYTAGSLYAPITSAVFTVGGQVPYLKDALGVVGKGFSRVGEQLKYIPGYNQYRESLPPEDQARLDGLAGNMIAAFVGSKGKGKITKGDLQGYLADNFSDFASLDKAFGQSIVKGTKATIAGVKKGAQGAGNFGLEVLGKTTGTSAETIKQVYKAAAKGDTSAIEGLRGVIDDADVIESMKSSVQEIIDDRKTLYGKGYEELKKTKTPIDIRQVAGDTLRDLNNDLGVRFDAEGNLDFSQSKITSPAAQKNLQGIIDDLKNREDTSPLGLDILKQRVQDYARYTPEFAKSDRFATAVSNKIKNKITEIVPSYEDMMRNYGQASDLLKEIKQATAVGGNKANIATIGTKLKGLLRDNQEVRRMIVEKMQEVTGKNILGQVAGLQMQPRTPKGLQGVALGAGVGVLSQLADPTLLGGLLVASPRLVGEVANAVGVSVNFVQSFADKFKSFFKKNANGLDVSNGDMLRHSLPAGNAKVKTSKGQTPIPPKPTPKTPPITVEKGAIGMGTPKAKVAPVIPPKATVAPSVSAPKVDTFKRMTQLDTDPNFKKQSLKETNYGRNAKGLETEYGTVEKVNVNNRYDPTSYTINGKDYSTSEVNNFWKKQTSDELAAVKVNRINSDAATELRSIEKSPTTKTYGSNLKGILDELGIKDVNSIPEGTESDILQMVRARKPVAPKKGMPKLGKEIMEQDMGSIDNNLIQEAKKYKSADEFIKAEPVLKVKIESIKPTEGHTQENTLGINGVARKEFRNKPILVEVDSKDPSKLYILDGNHRYFEQLSRGDKEVTVKVNGKGIDTDGYKARLKQIREQANKKPLPPLPKKGK